MADLPVHYAPSVGTPEGKARDRWFRLEPDEAGPAMVVEAKRIEHEQAPQREEWRIYGSLYAGKELSNLYQFGTAPSADLPLFNVGGHAVSFNVCASCVDTVGAKVSKNRPRVMFMTDGGNWSEVRRAKGLTKFTDGMFYEGDVYEGVSQPAFRDACVFAGGVGMPLLDPFDAKVTAERVLPFELLVDEVEALYGAPRSMYRVKHVARDVVAEWLGRKDAEKRARIMDARTVDPANQAFGRNTDQIAVYEGWHLPPGGGVKGVHVIAIDGCTLLHEPWTRQYFPPVVFRWKTLPTGFWGQSLVSELAGLQFEMNSLLAKIRRSHKLASGFKWAVERGSQVIPDHLTNEDGAVVSFVGQAPQAFTIQAIHPEVYQWVQAIYDKAFERAGVSKLSAGAKKPEGLDAAVALREYHDIEDQRFVVQGQAFENFHLQLARRMIDLAREAYENNKALRTKAPGSKLLEQIAWKDVALDEDLFEMRPFPTSILPTTPAAKMQRVQEMIESGMLPREQGLMLLDMPDLEGAVSLQTAAIRDVERVLETILDKGRYETPEPHMDLALAVKMAHSAFLRARAENAPEKRLDLLLRFIDEADSMQKEITPPAAPMPMPPPGMPGAAPPLPGTPSMGAAAAPPLPPGIQLPMEAGSPAVPSELPA